MAFKERVPEFINDMVGLVGTGLLFFGCYMIRPWLGFIVAGLLLIIFSLINGRRINNRGSK